MAQTTKDKLKDAVREKAETIVDTIPLSDRRRQHVFEAIEDYITRQLEGIDVVLTLVADQPEIVEAIHAAIDELRNESSISA